MVGPWNSAVNGKPNASATLRSEATEGLVKLRSTWLRKLGVRCEREATSLSEKLRSSRSRRIVEPRSGSYGTLPVARVQSAPPDVDVFS